MDNTIKRHREVIKRLLQNHAKYRSQGNDGVTSLIVFDDTVPKSIAFYSIDTGLTADY